MGNLADVIDSLMQVIADIGAAESVAVAWENVAHPGTVPRIEVQTLGTVAETAELSSGVVQVSGLLQCTVVVSATTGSIRANEIASSVAAAFASTVRLYQPQIRFRPAQLGPGLPDGDEFRLPVSVRWVATLEG